MESARIKNTSERKNISYNGFWYNGNQKNTNCVKKQLERELNKKSILKNNGFEVRLMHDYKNEHGAFFYAALFKNDEMICRLTNYSARGSKVHKDLKKYYNYGFLEAHIKQILEKEGIK